MSELGKSVFKAIIFLNEFFKDISKLITTVEEGMTRNKLVSLWGSQSYWGRSGTYYTPTKWMPTYVARQYVEESADGSKPDKKSPWFVFFNVYFTPKKIEEPVAVWGLGVQIGGKDLWQPFDKLALSEDGPSFLEAASVDEWESVESLPKSLSSFKYRARRVVDLKDAKTADEIVIRPLLEEVHKLRESS